MAVKSIFALFVLFSFTSSSKAKLEICREVRCELLPVGGGFASEFRLKSSEEGVRLIYLNLEIGTDPLEIKDDFLPERWVWANTISEPMLSLSYDYDILSLGLLTYQVRSINVSLEDEPSGCLASLNASCHDKVVGRALLNETKHSSGELFHETDVVCVAIIENATDFYSIYMEDNVKYHCCGKGKQGSAEGSSIHCDLIVNSSGWFKAFDDILDILTLVMVFYCSAFPLAVPDFIFNLREECKKEEQRDKPQKRIGKRQTSRWSINQSLDGHSNTDKITLLRSENESIQTNQLSSNVEDGQPDPRLSENKPINSELVYLDDASPITYSTFFGQYTKDFLDLIPFNVKLAFLWYCVIPIFVYIKLVLNSAKKIEFFETSRKQQAHLVRPLLSLFWNSSNSFGIGIAVIPLIVTFFLSPKDFLLTNENVHFVYGRCLVCFENTSSVGQDMLKHLEILQLKIYNFSFELIDLHKKGIKKSIKCCTHSCLEKMRPPYKRLKKPFIVIWVLGCNAFLIIFFGVFLGAIYFCFFLVWLVLHSLFYSPLISLFFSSGRKGSQIMVTLLRCFQKWFIGTKRTTILLPQNYCCYISIIFLYVFYFILIILLFIILELALLFYILFEIILLLATCYIAALSCRFIVRMFGYIIIGLVLNAEIASPFLAFFVVASINMHLCYYNLQKKYGDIKEMISQQWQADKNLLDNANLSNIEQGTIPEDLFWHICGEKSKSKHKVLHIWPEICRMLCNMGVNVIFLLLSLCSIIFLGSMYNISSVASTIAVFVSGVIPRLFFKGLTKENSFRGPTKIRMLKEVEKAVKEYIAIVNVRNSMGTGSES